MEESTPTEYTGPRPFSQFLIEQRTGGLHNELSERLAELVAACSEQRKGGSLTLTIRIAPIGKGTGQFEVSDDVKMKAPEAERGASLFFGDAKGNLSRHDPRQPELPLRAAPQPPSTIREVQS